MRVGDIREGFLEEGTLALSLEVQIELNLVEGLWMRIAGDGGEHPGGGIV